jgi:ribosomal protein bL25 (Ctc-form)
VFWPDLPEIVKEPEVFLQFFVPLIIRSLPQAENLCYTIGTIYLQLEGIIDMADAISISLQKREVTGKQVRQLRREGLVPAVIHDHGKPSIVVSGVYMDMARTYRQAGKNHPVQVEADGKKYTALIKKVDLDPRKNTLTHVVFNAVKANQKVDAEVPIRIKLAEGNDSTPAERAGLIVLHNMESVEVVAIPTKLPDSVWRHTWCLRVWSRLRLFASQ